MTPGLAPSARLRRLILGLLLLALIPLAGALRASDAPGRASCAFRVLTGRPCVFCGLTRALGHGVRGELAQAYALNPLWIPAVIAMISTAGLSLADAFRGSDRFGALWRRLVARGWVIAAVIFATTLVRVTTSG